MRITLFQFLLIVTCLPFAALSQRGKDGDLTVSAQETWINTYTQLTANASIGQLQITVADNTLSGAFFANDLASGDLILILQMYGASVDINTWPVDGWGGDYTVQQSFFSNGNVFDPIDFGGITNYNNAGRFQLVEVAGVSGANIIQLNCALNQNFTQNRNVQVVRVPRFSNLTVQNNASITAPQWNGLNGGVVAMEVDEDLTLNGTGSIDASALGFRGGAFNNIANFAGSPNDNAGYLGTPNEDSGGQKGEGIYGYHNEYDAIYSRYGYGAIANGGGGGNFHNSGGGGGSNVGTGTFYGYGVADPGAANAYVPGWNLENPAIITQPSSGGGRGGYTHAINNENPLTLGPGNNGWGGDYRRVAGGIGGHPLTYSSERIFFGGGGGAGCGNDGYGGTGGRGGGLVFLNVYGSISGTGSIAANGENGGNAVGPSPGFTGRTGDDGAGGAGGGGSVYIQNIAPIPGSIALTANGGTGGNQVVQIGSFSGVMSAEGPGGGGAGGLIVYTSGTPTESAAGGASGVTNSTHVSNFPINGATGGAGGVQGMANTFFELLVENDTICGGGSTTLSVTVVGTLPTGAQVQWFTSSFGGAPIASGNSFTTPVLSTTTSYYIGVCPGTFRKEVEVVVSDEITISGPPSIVDETCSGNDGAITGLTASGGFGNLIFDWNGIVTPDEDLTNVQGGSYTLTVTDENGCQETAGPYMIQQGPGPAIDLTNLQISDETCNGDDGAITGIQVTGSNVTYEWNGNSSASADLNNMPGGTYTLVVEDDVGCTATAGPFQIEVALGPNVDDSNLEITDESCFGNDGGITGLNVSEPGLTFSWNGNITPTIDLENSSEGVYTLVVTDASGCTTEMGPYTINQTPGPSIDDSNISIEDETCDQANGAITGLVASGNNISFTWNGTAASGEDISDLTAGTYTLTVTDNEGCEAIAGPFSVDNIQGPQINLADLQITSESCEGNNGAITGIEATGANLTYTWNLTDNTPTADYIGLSEGSYGLVVEDENGCQAIAGPFEIGFVPGPEIDDANLTVLDETCVGADGSITGLSATGTDLTFFWNGNEVSSMDLNNLSVGAYTLEVVDAEGCSVQYGPVEVNGVSPAVVTVSPIDTTIIAGENVPIEVILDPVQGSSSISWSPTIGLSCNDCFNPTASPSETITYFATVVDENGCETVIEVSIEVENNCGEPFAPNMFSPNGDGVNDFFCIHGECINELSLAVYNRWGERVFFTENPNDCWDGEHKGEPLNTGIFFFKASGVTSDGQAIELSGNITLLR
jgi:gliding motility-associated-like protein